MYKLINILSEIVDEGKLKGEPGWVSKAGKEWRSREENVAKLKSFLKDLNNTEENQLDLLPGSRYFVSVKSHDRYFPKDPWEKKFLIKIKKILTKVAKESKHKNIFSKQHPKAATIFGSYAANYPEDPWIDKINKSFIPVGNLFKRMVYLYEFPDKTSYIGLTADETKRKSAHLNSDRSQVFKYAKDTNQTPSFYRLAKNESGKIVKTKDLKYIDAIEAQKLEKEAVDYYRNVLKRKTINIKPAGGLGYGGGFSPVDKAKLNSFLDSNDTSLDTLKLVPFTKADDNGFTRGYNYLKDNKLEDKFFKRLQAIVKKHDLKVLWVKEGSPREKEGLSYYAKGPAKIINNYDKDHGYDKDNPKSWKVQLFGYNIASKFYMTKLEQFVNSSSTDESELDLLTWKFGELLHQHDKENPTKPWKDKVFNKIQKILKKNNIGAYVKANRVDTTKSISAVSPIAKKGLEMYQKEYPKDDWKHKLFPNDTQIKESVSLIDLFENV
jgi:hypothetical protein